MSGPGVDGSSERVELILKGAPYFTEDSVTSFTEDPIYRVHEHEGLGTDDVDRSPHINGHSLSWAYRVSKKAADDFVDTYNSFVAAHIKPELTAIRTTRYDRTGEFKTVRHDDVVLDSVSRSTSRSGETTISFAGKSRKRTVS